jgi:hypothetical protein
MSTRPLAEVLFSHPSSVPIVLQSRWWEKYLYKQHLKETYQARFAKKLTWAARSGTPILLWMRLNPHSRDERWYLARMLLVKKVHKFPVMVKAAKVALMMAESFNPLLPEYVPFEWFSFPMISG